MEPTEYDDWKWRTKQPLTPVRLKTWKKELTSEEIDVVTGLTFPMLKRHGYATYGVTQKVGDIAFWKQTLQLRIKTIARRGRVRKIGLERWWQR